LSVFEKLLAIALLDLCPYWTFSKTDELAFTHSASYISELIGATDDKVSVARSALVTKKVLLRRQIKPGKYLWQFDRAYLRKRADALR